MSVDFIAFWKPVLGTLDSLTASIVIELRKTRRLSCLCRDCRQTTMSEIQSLHEQSGQFHHSRFHKNQTPSSLRRNRLRNCAHFEVQHIWHRPECWLRKFLLSAISFGTIPPKRLKEEEKLVFSSNCITCFSEAKIPFPRDYSKQIIKTPTEVSVIIHLREVFRICECQILLNDPFERTL